MNYMLWILFFPLSFAATLLCQITAPIVAMLITTEPRTDRVKRIGNKVLTFDREYIIKPLRWWQTHDNAVDEYWWGMFNGESYFRIVREATQDQYDRSALLRWFCRLTWMERNAAYGFAYHLLGRPLDTEVLTRSKGTKGNGCWYELVIRKSSWQLKAQIQIFGKFYNDINIGWKPHKGFNRVMFAGRVIGFRKYE